MSHPVLGPGGHYYHPRFDTPISASCFRNISPPCKIVEVTHRYVVPWGTPGASLRRDCSYERCAHPQVSAPLDSSVSYEEWRRATLSATSLSLL